MVDMLRVPNFALGQLEKIVLEILWEYGPLNPLAVHEHVGRLRAVDGPAKRLSGHSIKTVSSALKRLFEKGLLHREKVSHAFVYQASVSRVELQRQLIGTLSQEFGEKDHASFLAAFVDMAEASGEETLRRLESMISERLESSSK